MKNFGVCDGTGKGRGQGRGCGNGRGRGYRHECGCGRPHRHAWEGRERPHYGRKIFEEHQDGEVSTEKTDSATS